MTLSAGQSSTVCCQAKLTDKDSVLDTVQGLGQAICFHSRRTHKLQQDLSLLYLLVDPFVTDIDMPHTRSLQGVKYSQPGVLAVCIDEQRYSLQVSSLYINLCNPFDTEGYRREINEFDFSGRDCYNCLFLRLPNNWTTRQENYMASYKDFYKKVVYKRRVAIYIEIKIRNILASTNIQVQRFCPGHISPEMLQHRDILFRRAFVSLGQTVRGILDIKTDDCCREIQYSHFGHRGLDGIQIKTIPVFL